MNGLININRDLGTYSMAHNSAQWEVQEKRDHLCMVVDIVINRLNATTYSVSTMSALH